jgi:hypothetical protein
MLAGVNRSKREFTGRADLVIDRTPTATPVDRRRISFTSQLTYSSADRHEVCGCIPQWG